MSTITRWLGLGALVGAGWIGTLAGVALLSDAAPALLVVLPPPDFADRLPSEVRLLTGTGRSLTVAGPPGLAATLYAAGAPLVLPAGLTGCPPLPDR